jgi:hypothetical protein
VSDGSRVPANPPAEPSKSPDDAGWGAMLADTLRQTGGALSDDERAWADEVLGIGAGRENQSS